MFKRLAELFEGDPAKFITTSLTGEVDDRGKREAKYLTIHEPATEKVWKNHIDGKTRIGVRPENGDKVKWGCIDVDPTTYKDYSQKKYVDIIREYKLPLILIILLHFIFTKNVSHKLNQLLFITGSL